MGQHQAVPDLGAAQGERTSSLAKVAVVEADTEVEALVLSVMGAALAAA